MKFKMVKLRQMYIADIVYPTKHKNSQIIFFIFSQAGDVLPEYIRAYCIMQKTCHAIVNQILAEVLL